MSLNEYDHEDAFKDANRCAGRLTTLSDTLQYGLTRDEARGLIAEARDIYSNLFQAFIEGVDYGRRHPKETK